jgi:hypothetical protein
MVRGDDHAADVPDGVLPQVLLINPEHVRGRGRVHLHVVVEGISIDVPEIARPAHAEDDALHEPVEATQQVSGRYLGKVPRPDGVLDGLEQRVLADALRTAEHQRVINLLVRTLHAMRHPRHDVLRIGAVNRPDVFDHTVQQPWRLPAQSAAGDRD